MRAVVYARYSTENQRDASIEDQVRTCRAEVGRQGWQFLRSYCDRAISGASLLRAGYQKLLEDARAGSFEVVIAEALDRLSRDQADIANLYKHLSFLGVRLVTLAEGEISELHVGLKGTMNALFLKDLAQKTRRGLEVTTLWQDLDSLKAFAGENWNRSVIPPEEVPLIAESFIHHYEVFRSG